MNLEVSHLYDLVNAVVKLLHSCQQLSSYWKHKCIWILVREYFSSNKSFKHGQNLFIKKLSKRIYLFLQSTHNLFFLVLIDKRSFEFLTNLKNLCIEILAVFFDLFLQTGQVLKLLDKILDFPPAKHQLLMKVTLFYAHISVFCR